MDPKLEIRKLQPSSLRELTQILEYGDSWKELMAIIPKTLDKNNYSCNISCENPPKYNSEHVRLIENASFKMRKACTDILFDEWGTSGRVRPALGHLLYLLIKSQLFRAADYVAINLLQIQPPPRPSVGPAALVNTSLPNQNFLNEIEEFLNEASYPSSLISNLNGNANSRSNLQGSVIPQIIITNVNDKKRRAGHVHFNSEEINKKSSDLIHFSETEKPSSSDESNDIPAISALLLQTSTSNMSNSIDSNHSEVNNILTIGSMHQIDDESNNNQMDNNNCDNVPALSILNMNSDKFNKSTAENKLSENIPQLSTLLNSSIDNKSDKAFRNTSLSDIDNNLPVLSALNMSLTNCKSNSIQFENDTDDSFKEASIALKEKIINERSQDLINSGSLPHLSSLLWSKSISKSKLFMPTLENDETKLNAESLSDSSKNSNTSRGQCVSPLPNLLLNTKLPRFTYQQLEDATSNFDETPHQSSCDRESSINNSSGRFLGSGAFGSVFLALGLLDRPVAVKRLFLDNVNVVNIDDPITKQFKNEVEILSKYQHDNLLSLVGYSCDGPTYCLLYEYIPGGALKERLQNKEDKLMWTDRLYIAMGTAKGISYLHNAYSTPLIHRDIKTANILLDCSNKPKLCDFGIIKLLPNQNTNTSTTVFGTSAYMAPEAFRGDISIKLDTFSFGVVILELLTSLPPFDSQREDCDIVTHVEGTCENDISLLLDKSAGSWIVKNVNFAEKLYEIATKCLSEKKKRPTMTQITSELSDLISFVK
ncbi:protein Tube [Agrilus planipennis]|uniref:non-specific serine/threonine protein kinase n=1 Tax=Agrilus planipennis TaxID=224129 RepID=A0A1W4WWJ8_AGRPL|nr:protein Tube [Agrilus planipennis]